jgi:hypothetical protein
MDELPPEPGYHFILDRRKFLALTGGGLVVAFVFQDILSFSGKLYHPELPGLRRRCRCMDTYCEDGR